MTAADAALLFSAGTVAGALNSVAGGGSFVSFPALLFTGVPAIPANATNTIALQPGAMASAWAYRRQFSAHRAAVVALGAVSLAGGLAGALLLLKTPERTFLWILPWLLLFATLLFSFGPALTSRLRERAGGGEFAASAGSAPGSAGLGGARSRTAWLAVAAIQFAIAVYGGYFGGGIGIMMLAALSLSGMTNIHEMNAFKTLLGSVINGVAVVAFIVAGVAHWPQGLTMMAGAVLGGYFGAHWAQRVDPKLVRALVIVTGAAMTVYFFLRG
jgi:hypothetical protein